MQWKAPKNSAKYHWTQHVAEKMHYYGLSEQKVLGVIRKPMRTETGIVENTVAVMVPVGNIKKGKTNSKWSKSFNVNEDEGIEKWNQELWVLYQVKSQYAKFKAQSSNEKIQELQQRISLNNKITIISAWRYPGVSPKNNPIPEDILREIEEVL